MQPVPPLILNHYSPNKGDRAVLYFILREFKRAGIEEVTVSCSDPEMTRSWQPPSESGIRLVPWGLSRYWPPGGLRFAGRHLQFWGGRTRCKIIRGLIRGSHRVPLMDMVCDGAFWQALRQSHVAISTGGHHVTTLVHDDAFCPQVYDMALALLAGRPLVLWSQTIGPFNFRHVGSKELVQTILRQAAEIWVRDEGAVADMRSIGIVRDVAKTYDSVFGLNDALSDFVPPCRREPVAGIAVYTKPHCPNDHYVHTLARLVDFLLQEKLTIRFFPMEVKGSGGDDRPLIRQILGQVKHPEGCQIADRDLHPLEHLLEVSKCRLFIGHKTHSVVFALTTGTPLVALAYHRKTLDFMDQFELRRFAIPDVELSEDGLRQNTRELLSELDQTAEQIHVRAGEVGQCVRDDFQSILRRWCEVGFRSPLPAPRSLQPRITGTT